MGQIFACILPCFFRSTVEEFSDIRDERPLKHAHLCKRISSYKGANYIPKVSNPGAVTAGGPDEVQPAPLEDNEINLTERIPFKITVDLKYVKPNRRKSSQFRRSRRSLRGSNRKNRIAPRNDEVLNIAPRTDKSAIREAWRVQPGNSMQRPRPSDFYTKAFGVKPKDSSECPVSAKPVKKKSWWEFKLEFPSLSIRFWKGK